MTRGASWYRDERGSVVVEALIVLPALALFLLLIVLGGRYALAQTAVQSAAADAARAASISRTGGEAHSNANARAHDTLTNQGVPCANTSVDVDVSGFKIPVGQPSSVSASVACQVSVAGLSGLPLPGSLRVEYTASSPLDVYRGR